MPIRTLATDYDGTIATHGGVDATTLEANAALRSIVRGDSGFCRWRMLHWCEWASVDYIIGLARNIERKLVADKIFTNPTHKQTEDYISGRFG